jgi:hypothetical protein
MAQKNKNLFHWPGGRVDPARKPLNPLFTPEAVVSAVRQEDLSQAFITKAVDHYKSKAHAVAIGLISQSNDTVLDQYNILENPGAVADLVSYTVLDGDVAMIDQIGVYYSEPTVSASIMVGWRIIVDSGEVTNIGSGSFEFRFSSFGDVMEPMKIDPLWLQSGQTIRIEVEPTADKINAFDGHLVMTGRLSGRIYHPSNIETIMVI